MWFHKAVLQVLNQELFNQACQYADGAIIGSAFIRVVSNQEKTLEENICSFISSILKPA